MFDHYATALFALQRIDKYILGRIIREVSHDILRQKYALKYETRSWHHQSEKILASPIPKSPGAVTVLETGIGTVHLDHEPSIKVLKDLIIAAESHAQVCQILEQIDFQFLLPDENYDKGE